MTEKPDDKIPRGWLIGVISTCVALIGVGVWIPEVAFGVAMLAVGILGLIGMSFFIR